MKRARFSEEQIGYRGIVLDDIGLFPPGSFRRGCRVCIRAYRCVGALSPRALVNCSDVAEQRLPAVGIRYAKLILPRRHAVERSEKGRDLHSSNGKSGARRLRPSFKHQVIFSQFTISSWSAELSATCQTRAYGDFLIDT
jgi:hypothetical protein